MYTKTSYGEEARNYLKSGVDEVANAVALSMGAAGRNVFIPQEGGGYIVTKDGVSIARSILPKGTIEQIGAAMVKQAAHQTNQAAGDGTSSATVIARALFDKGLQFLSSRPGASVSEFKRGIDASVKALVEELEQMGYNLKPADTTSLENIATISSNGDKELGRFIATAFSEVGKNGTVISDVSDTAETHIELREGVVLDSGYWNKVFLTDRVREIVEMENPLVLLSRHKIERGQAFVDLLDQVFSKGKSRNLLIIADDVDPFVVSTLSENIRRGALSPGQVCVVKTPQILKINKDLLDDVALLTGAKVVSDITGVKLNVKALGSLQRARISLRETLLVGDQDNLAPLVEELEERISIETNEFERKEIQERLSRITGKVATLYVGALTDAELKERQDRVEDAINATRSTLEEGYVPGGGTALLQAAYYQSKSFSSDNPGQSQEFYLGSEAVFDACQAPFTQILKNAEIKAPRANSLAENLGIDVRTGERVNMVKAGIIDPLKVVRCALENAASAAGIFLTTEAVVVLRNE